MSNNLVIAGETIAPGQRMRVNLHVARLYDFTEMNVPIEVVRGKKDGPRLFVCAAIHGNEINGVDIIRRLLGHKALSKIKGTLIAVPIVNVFGFNTKSRYLPDGRDLNRYFPGSADGSLAAQLAHIFTTEILEKCTHGIDLHTAGFSRANLPQIRANLSDPVVQEMAHAFKVPVLINANFVDGSLRQAADERGIPLVLFEGGEALKFNEQVIRCGLQGVLSVMRTIGMLPRIAKRTPDEKEDEKKKTVFVARSRHWVRAPYSGILRSETHLGARVKKNQLLGSVSDPFGGDVFEIRARKTGIVVGTATLPLVNAGDAAFHIATFEDSGAVEEQVELFEGKVGNGKSDRFLN
ncbi:MAG: succinylglutamate desuccinylase/aspartoacylase family protein [Alphaproteobacteria bacterium]|nr:MAG: succinylglutamate desuccinylase/aspartoacylase family protein [Alphaproteobacteria bacterium]